MTTLECGLDVTHCTECDDELEAGQVGICDSCRTYTFAELSESAKQRARDDYTSRDYPHDDWWDDVYEDAVCMAKIIGIEISETAHKGRSGKTFRTIAISFSGFCSQGDGACFEGDYEFAPEAISKISAETNDGELIRIAVELYTLQLTRRMTGLAYFSASIKTSGRGSHSGTMDVTTNTEEFDEDSGEVLSNDVEDEVTQLMRDFADWIYSRLEAEHDWLHSDECVDAALEDHEFDENGVII